MAHPAMRSRRGRRGITVVEVALMLPLLLLLIFGLIEYSWAFLKAGEITNAARECARYAISPDVTTVGQLTSSSSPLVQSLEKAGINLADVNLHVPTGVTPGRGQEVEISLTVPYERIKLLGVPLMPGPSTLSATVRMMKEGP